MTPRISSTTLVDLFAAARAANGREICGLLVGGKGDAVVALPAGNVAAAPETRFEIDPAILIAAHRAARDGGPAILGHYHSHPSGDPEPSARDAADAAPDGSLWLILGRDRARMWRAVPQGPVQGRFDAVAFDVIAGNRLISGVRGVSLADETGPWSLYFEY